MSASTSFVLREPPALTPPPWLGHLPMENKSAGVCFFLQMEDVYLGLEPKTDACMTSSLGEWPLPVAHAFLAYPRPRRAVLGAHVAVAS